MDPFYIDAILGELAETVRGAAVSKIYQTGPGDFIFRLWTGRENRLLLLSVAPRTSRIHLTSTRLPTPAAPPRFCQLLRSRLRRLLAAERVGGERIVRFFFSGSGERQRWTLVAELLGPHANLLLLDDEELIVDALHRRTESDREIRPGILYRPPDSQDRHPLEGELPPISGTESLRSWLLANVTPMTPLLAADLEAASASGISLQVALRGVAARWREGRFHPCIGLWQGREVLTALPPEHLSLEDLRRYSSPSQAADAFYASAAGDATFSAGKPELDKVVRRALARLRKRLEHIETEAARSGEFERQRELGDLLLANLHRLARGMAEVSVADWFAPSCPQVSIPLEPALSPQENAEAYFRRHRKGRRAVEHIERRRIETLAEIDWLEVVAMGLEETSEAAEIAAVRNELETAGFLRRRAEPGLRRSPTAVAELVRTAVTPGGHTLYWGKSNRGNDHVSRHLTGPDDIWFHALNMPGCHLVLKRRSGNEEIAEEEVLFAAAIAAFHSRGQNSGKVEVMVASGKSVRRPKGGLPGLVMVDRYRTVVVSPQENCTQK